MEYKLDPPPGPSWRPSATRPALPPASSPPPVRPCCSPPRRSPARRPLRPQLGPCALLLRKCSPFLSQCVGDARRRSFLGVFLRGGHRRVDLGAHVVSERRICRFKLTDGDVLVLEQAEFGFVVGDFRAEPCQFRAGSCMGAGHGRGGGRACEETLFLLRPPLLLQNKPINDRGRLHGIRDGVKAAVQS